MAIMDIGQIGNEDIIFKRKFRWLLYYDDGKEIYTAKMAARPTLSLEETAIDRLHEKHWISGKGTWDAIDITLYDVKSNANVGGIDNNTDSGKFIQWLKTVWSFSSGERPSSYGRFDMGDHDAEYKKNLALQLLSGHGVPMETWWLIGCWPQNVSWGSLEYSSSDPAEITIKMRFDRADFFNGDASTSISGETASNL